MAKRETGWRIFAALAAVLLVSIQLGGCSAPTRAKVISLEKPTKKSVSRNRSSYHRVRRGDTLYTIAWLYGLDVPEIAGWNGIGPPYTIYPGQSLRLSPPAKRVAQARPKAKGASPERKLAPAAKNPHRSGSTRRSAAETEFTGRKRLVWQWPTQGKVEQRFSSVDPSRKGIQISGRSGQKVVAAESGKVVYAGSGLIGYGRLIIIKHNKNYLSAYGHNRKLLVKEGKVVKKGEPVAEMGKKGGGRPTLHFEIRRNGTPVNPTKLLPRRR